MGVALVVLTFPSLLYLASLFLIRKLRKGLRWFYVILGGLLVFGGGACAVYAAAYAGDQGGITAFYLQLLTLLVLIALALGVMVLQAVWTKMDHPKQNQSPRK